MPSHRMHRGLVTLSASAVAAIYFAGYLRTQAADAALGPAAVDTSPVVAAVVPSATPTTVVVQRSAQPTTRPSQPTPQPSPTATTAPSSPAVVATGYKDGTYAGSGTSRRGDVWVSVQIQGGQIANVTITRSTLQYPLRDIANLPSQVVQSQRAMVVIVNRATSNSMDFR